MAILVPYMGLVGVALGYTFGIFIGIGYQIIIAIIKINKIRNKN